MIAYKFAAVFASTILGIAVAAAVAHPSAVTQDGRFLWRDGSSMMKRQTFRLKLRRSSAHCHTRHSISMFGFAKSIAICLFGNVATMSRVVS